MTLRALQRLCLGLVLFLNVNAIDLSTFSGQAETKLLMESVAGQETTTKAREMLLKAADDPPDYTCTATKRCDLGCCGPL